MDQLITMIRVHGTKILGLIGVTIGVLAVADPELVGGPIAIKYYLLAQSLLTVWRGYFNTDAMKIAAEVKSDPTNPANPTSKSGG